VLPLVINDKQSQLYFSIEGIEDIYHKNNDNLGYSEGNWSVSVGIVNLACNITTEDLYNFAFGINVPSPLYQYPPMAQPRPQSQPGNRSCCKCGKLTGSTNGMCKPCRDVQNRTPEVWSRNRW